MIDWSEMGHVEWIATLAVAFAVFASLAYVVRALSPSRSWGSAIAVCVGVPMFNAFTSYGLRLVLPHLAWLLAAIPLNLAAYVLAVWIAYGARFERESSLLQAWHLGLMVWVLHAIISLAGVAAVALGTVWPKTSATVLALGWVSYALVQAWTTRSGLALARRMAGAGPTQTARLPRGLPAIRATVPELSTEA